MSGVVPVRHFPNVVSELASLFTSHEVTILTNATSRRIFAQLSDLWEESYFPSRWMHGADKIHVQILHRQNVAA
jgi:hypothetical protein